MTAVTADPVCEWCGERFARPSLKGPMPRFCSQSHRQRAYEQRRLAALIAKAIEFDRLTQSSPSRRNRK
jgi:hypothetical protein